MGGYDEAEAMGEWAAGDCRNLRRNPADPVQAGFTSALMWRSFCCCICQAEIVIGVLGRSSAGGLSRGCGSSGRNRGRIDLRPEQRADRSIYAAQNLWIVSTVCKTRGQRLVG